MPKLYHLSSLEGAGGGTKDNFSRQSSQYAQYRPGYPDELFEFILGHVVNRECAWDCGTGNGQTAKILAIHFEKVFATDISSKQIEQAFVAENISYSLQPAEHTNFSEDQFDLVTVSQALHWFRLDEFYREVKRVVRSGGWIAAWCYSNLHISPGVDELINVQHYKNLLGEYWDPERKYVDEYYRSLPFPFKEIKTPGFEIKMKWTLEHLQGYLETWSALHHFIKKNNFNPVPELIKKIEPLWTNDKMKVIFPVHLRMAQIDK